MLRCVDRGTSRSRLWFMQAGRARPTQRRIGCDIRHSPYAPLMSSSDSVSGGALWFTLSLVNAGLAQGKGRSGLAWWLLSLLLGPLATLLIVVLPAIGHSRRAGRATHLTCSSRSHFSTDIFPRATRHRYAQVVGYRRSRGHMTSKRSRWRASGLRCGHQLRSDSGLLLASLQA